MQSNSTMVVSFSYLRSHRLRRGRDFNLCGDYRHGCYDSIYVSVFEMIP